MDVAIVGAGPAGAAAAFALARGGARVTIFDPSHPREKPCGGGVTGRALALVADAVRSADFPAAPIRTARFVDSARGRSAVVDLDAELPFGAPAIVVASRKAFDDALVRAAVAAGATLVASRVLDVTADASGGAITAGGRMYPADVVVGADGATSLVRRRFAPPFRRDQLSIAAGFFADGVTSHEIVIEFTAEPPGYFWSFPRPDHLAIGVCGSAAVSTSPSLRARAAAWGLGVLGTLRAEPPASSPQPPLRPYSWPIPSLAARDFDALPIAGPRWALAGDAAGLVDPLTREGIYFALASGLWIAGAVLTGRFPDAYAARVHDEIVPELSRAARVQRAFFQPALARLLIDALDRSAAIRAVMADLIAGRQSYATLKWRLLQTFEIGLALRAARLRHRA